MSQALRRLSEHHFLLDCLVKEEVVRNRCGRGNEPPVRELGPRLYSAEEAVAALRLSAGAGAEGRESIVVLVCDPDRRIGLAVEFEGAPATGATEALACVLPAVPAGSSLVVGLFRRGETGPDLDHLELVAVEDMASSCRRSGVGLLAVIVVSSDGWRSLTEVASIGFGGDNDCQ